MTGPEIAAAYVAAFLAYALWWSAHHRRAAEAEARSALARLVAESTYAAAEALRENRSALVSYEAGLTVREREWVETGIYIAARIRAHRGEAFRA